MTANSTEVVHYTTWGTPGIVCGGHDGNNASSRHEAITCPECKAHPTYRSHVFQRELAFDGNFSNWLNAVRDKYFKGESTND